MSAEIIPLRLRFDPSSADAERRYDHVVHRMNRLAVAQRRQRRRILELERQFVDDDLCATSGRRRGQALTRAGRRRRLHELLQLDRELQEMQGEWARLGARLESMNEALDHWARTTYGAGLAREIGDDPSPAKRS